MRRYRWTWAISRYRWVWGWEYSPHIEGYVISFGWVELLTWRESQR